MPLPRSYKQQGPAALDADNVFRHITHAGAVDLEALPDPLERRALLAAIQEFGQSPRAIFDRSHPRRLVAPPPPPPERAFAGPGERGGSGQAVSLALVSAVLAAAADATHTPLEVPELLGQLDVAARRREQEAAAAPVATAARAVALNDSRTEPSDTPSSQAEDATSEQSALSPSRASPSARLKQLVGGVKQVAAATASAVVSPADKVTSAAAASLRGLFARSKNNGTGDKDSVESSELSEEPARSPSSSSFMDRWKAFAGSKSSRSLTASDASGTAATAEEPLAHEPTAGQRQASSSGAATAGASAGAGVVLKQSRRTIAQRRANSSSASGSEDEAELQESQRSPRSLWQDLPEEQRLRMLAPYPGKTVAAAAEPGGWGPGLHDRLQQGSVAALGGETVQAVALAGVGPHAYAALASGGLRVLDLGTSQQLRAAQLGSQPLASLALLPQAPGSQSRAARQHPLVLAASYDGHVRAYQVESGRCIGSWQAHADTVSCLEVLRDGACAAAHSSLATASWDGSVRLWELAEGRQPWRDGGGGGQLVADLGSGVWALAAGCPGSQLLLTGTEDGLVALHDRRAPTPAWEQPLSEDYISGLAFLSEPRSNSSSSNDAVPAHAVVASGDGSVALLDLRKTGARLSFASCGTPLRCLATDSTLALAGGEDGALHIWDVASALGRPAPPGRWSRPDASGLYPALEAAPLAAVNALAVTALDGDLVVAVGHDGGVLRTWQAGRAFSATGPGLT